MLAVRAPKWSARLTEAHIRSGMTRRVSLLALSASVPAFSTKLAQHPFPRSQCVGGFGVVGCWALWPGACSVVGAVNSHEILVSRLFVGCRCALRFAADGLWSRRAAHLRWQ